MKRKKRKATTAVTTLEDGESAPKKEKPQEEYHSQHSLVISLEEEARLQESALQILMDRKSHLAKKLESDR